MGVTNAIKLEFFMTYDPPRDDNSGRNLLKAGSDKRVNFHLTTPSVLYRYQTCN